MQTLYIASEQALDAVKADLSKQFRPFELSKLLEGGYTSAERIRAASRESLQSLDLPPAAIDLIFAAVYPPVKGNKPLPSCSCKCS